jgi:N-acetylmuramoyl-L-alanine amidase
MLRMAVRRLARRVQEVTLPVKFLVVKHPISRIMFAIMFVVMAAFPVMASAAGSVVRDVRMWTAPDHTRLVLDLNQSIKYKLFRLHKPERIVIDMQNTRLKTRFNKLAMPDPVIKAIRHGTPKADVLRVVMDVKEKVQPRSFLLKPMQGKPYRLVIDLMRPQKDRAVAITVEKLPHKSIVIAIDAGHGGEDPGAIGPRKLREKDVTLAVAKKLAKIIDTKPGIKAVLIRKGDYFVSLKKRVYLARRAQADLMISIHADAVREHSVKGASVYTLSERGATQDRAAKALAAKENAADEVGGAGFDEAYDSQVNKILSDMFRRDSLNSSQILAEEMLRKLKRAGPIKYAVPKRARFFVLRAMEIPSVLVELDYISNPVRERKLKNGKHQQKLASALFNASIRFFEKMGRLRPKQGQALRRQREFVNADVDKQPSI